MESLDYPLTTFVLRIHEAFLEQSLVVTITQLILPVCKMLNAVKYYVYVSLPKMNLKLGTLAKNALKHLSNEQFLDITFEK